MVDINCENILSKPTLFTSTNNIIELKKRESIFTIINLLNKRTIFLLDLNTQILSSINPFIIPKKYATTFDII
jgi:hypothetical protein